jgi:hypothetical protein
MTLTSSEIQLLLHVLNQHRDRLLFDINLIEDAIVAHHAYGYDNAQKQHVLMTELSAISEMMDKLVK